jgi:hypothetical protein
LYPDPGFDKIEPSFVVSDAENWETTWRSARMRKPDHLSAISGYLFVLALINFAYYFIHRDNAYLNYTFYIVTSVLFDVTMISVCWSIEPLVISFPVSYFSPFLKTFIILVDHCILSSFSSSHSLNLKKRFPFWHKTFNVQTVYLGLVGLASSPLDVCGAQNDQS